jgi:predicted nucleic acid-binding Zn ribbon protein
MAERVPPHGHCQMCGKSTPVGETLCSEDCRQRYNNVFKKRKLIVYFMYGLLAALILVLVLGGRFIN